MIVLLENGKDCKAMTSKKKYKLLFITRKYPPAVGGMETFCYELMQGLDRERIELKLSALGKKEIQLIWFFP